MRSIYVWCNRNKTFLYNSHLTEHLFQWRLLVQHIIWSYQFQTFNKNTYTVYNRTVLKNGSCCTVRPGKASCLQKFLDDYPWFILWKWINRSNKNKKNTAKVCHLYFWSNNTALFEHWNWKSSFKHRGWYVFARRKGLKIYFFSTNSLNYGKYFLTIWWKLPGYTLWYWVSNCPGNMPKYYLGNMSKYYSTKYHYRNLHEE